MTTAIIVVLVILILTIVVTWILAPTYPHRTTYLHDRTLDRYHRTRDRSDEEPRAARRLE